MELIRPVAALIVFTALCGSASGQYLDFQQNLDGCLARNEYQACKAARGYSSANITPEQRRQVEAKMKAIEADIAKTAQSPSPPNREASRPNQPSATKTPLDELEKPFRTMMQGIGTIFEIIFGIIALLVVFFLYLKFSAKSKERAAWANLPADGPMQVNITEMMVPSGSFNSKRVKCGLDIDVKISQADWRAIADAGLMKKVLFYADGPSGEQYDPENVREWFVEDLKRPTHASFWDVDRMQQAKEELIVGLHNLRAHIDGARQGPKTDTFEI